MSQLISDVDKNKDRDISKTTIDFVVEEFTTQIKVTLTHKDWPTDGECINIELLFGGESTGLFSTGGYDVKDKSGAKLNDDTELVWIAPKPPGFTAGQLVFDNKKILKYSILVESI